MKLNIKELADKINIAEDLSKEELGLIAQRVDNGFDVDFESNTEWLRDVERVEELVLLKSKKKTTPLPNSANIKLPIITKACYEYSSRTYPEIVKDSAIVKTKIIGDDFMGTKKKKADIVSEYMNWQLYWRDDDWELELDRLLNRLALIGFLCKKVYYDQTRKKVCSELVEPQDLIINSEVKSLQDAHRVTQILHVRLNDIIEGARSGIYLEEEVDKLVQEFAPKLGEIPEFRQDNPYLELLEQHTFLDLDEDNYEEPYIITKVRGKQIVLRIAPRFEAKDVHEEDDEIKYIDACQHFIDFHFLVSPKGKFQSVGFGILLLYLTESANTVLNQLVDAGQLANMQGGLIDARMKFLGTGNVKFDPGQYNSVKTMAGMRLQDGVLPLDYKEPSSVLFQLLGLLLDTVKDLSASTDLMTGQSSPENSKTGATQAMIAEGVKVHNSISKRVYRSLGNEFYTLFKFNNKYIDPKEASKVLGKAVTKETFSVEEVDVIPVADPNLASVQKQIIDLQKLQFVGTLPGVNQGKIVERIVKQLIADKPEELLLDPKKTPPNPELIKVQADIENMAETNRIKGHELELRQQELKQKQQESYCKCLQLKADAMLKIAQAESLEQGQQYEVYMKQLDMMLEQYRAQNEQQSQAVETQNQQEQNAVDMQMQREQQAHDQMMQTSQQQHEQTIQSQQASSEGESSE